MEDVFQDCTKFKSFKTGRGPLPPDWMVSMWLKFWLFLKLSPSAHSCVFDFDSDDSSPIDISFLFYHFKNSLLHAHLTHRVIQYVSHKPLCLVYCSYKIVVRVEEFSLSLTVTGKVIVFLQQLMRKVIVKSVIYCKSTFVVVTHTQHHYTLTVLLQTA